jgi:hypothetical protein
VLAALGISLLIALLAGVAWANIEFSRSNRGGREFAVLWSGVRGFLMAGESPYGDQTSMNIQEMIYGHAAQYDQAPYKVDIPFYILSLLLPLGAISDFQLARATWMLLLELALVSITILSLRVVRWRLSIVWQIILLIFGLFWVDAAVPLVEGNPVIFTALLMVGILTALDAQMDELAGVLLFLSTFKLEAGLPFILFVLVWAISHRRYRVLAGIGMTAIVLVAIATLLLPDWPWPFMRSVVANLRYDSALTTSGTFETWWPGIGLRLARWLTLILMVVLFLEWRAVRRRDFRSMLWTASLTIVVTPLLGFRTVPENFIALYFSLLYIFSILDERWRQVGRGVILVILVLLFLGLWWLKLYGGSVGVGFNLLFPMLMVVLLYWVRWWAVRPPRTWLETITRETS